jgi:hypothetical protein
MSQAKVRKPRSKVQTPAPVLVRRPELARALQVTQRTIATLVVEGLPSVRRGRWRLFPLADCINWYAARAKRLAERDVHGVEYEEANRGHAWAKARRAVARYRAAERRVLFLAVGLDVMRTILARHDAVVVGWGRDLAQRLPARGSEPAMRAALDRERDVLLLRLQDDAGEAGAEPRRPLPTDDPALEYRESVSRAHATRLGALGKFHELETALAEGEVVPTDRFVARMATVYDIVRARLLNLSSAFAFRLVHPDDRATAMADLVNHVRELFRPPALDGKIDSMGPED